MKRLAKKRFLKLSVVLVVLVFLLSLVSGCVQQRPKTEKKAEGPTKGGTFNYFLTEPISLDSAKLGEMEGIQVGKQIFDGLVDYDPKTLELKPAIAESWKSNSDATVWTFKLKKGVKFHNGREVEAKDFVYSWSRVAAKETASDVAYHLAPIKGFDALQEGKAKELEGVEAEDKYTLKVTLNYPYAEFDITLGHPVFSPVPKEEVERWGDKFTEHPVGTGPFKFKEWKHNQEIVLERNDDYYQKEAYLDKIVFKIYQDEEAGFLEFKAGNLQATRIPLGQIKATKEDDTYGKYVQIKPILGLYYYGMNLEAPPWKDSLELRQALNYVIDRKAISKRVLEETRLPATGIVPPGIPGYQKKAMPYSYDLKKAKELLEKAGYPGGQGLPKITLAYDTGVGHEKVVQASQALAKDAGINFDLAGYEWGAYLDKIANKEITFFRLGWGADYPTWDSFLYPLFYSESTDNLFLYKNPEVDKLLLEARKETNEDKRIELYQKIEKMILKDAPLVLVAFDATRWVVQPEVRGFARTGLDDTPMESVWISKKEE